MQETRHKHYLSFKYNKKLIEKSGDARIYRDSILLTPGSWADVITQAPVVYSEDELRKGATKWESNLLNLDHSHFPLDIIGYVKNPKFSDHAVRADLYIYPITTNAKDTIALIDAGLIKHLSVEISTQDKWDPITNLRKAYDIKFWGLAVVIDPACKDSKIGK